MSMRITAITIFHLKEPLTLSATGFCGRKLQEVLTHLAKVCNSRVFGPLLASEIWLAKIWQIWGCSLGKVIVSFNVKKKSFENRSKRPRHGQKGNPALSVHSPAKANSIIFCMKGLFLGCENHLLIRILFSYPRDWFLKEEYFGKD